MVKPALQTHRQAMQCAESVEDPLHLAGESGEMVLGTFVDDEHRSMDSCQLPHGLLQDSNRIGHVVQHLDREDEVVVTDNSGIGSVANLEPHAVRHDDGIRVRSGDRDRRQPLAATDFGDAYPLAR